MRMKAGKKSNSDSAVKMVFLRWSNSCDISVGSLVKLLFSHGNATISSQSISTSVERVNDSAEELEHVLTDIVMTLYDADAQLRQMRL